MNREATELSMFDSFCDSDGETAAPWMFVCDSPSGERRPVALRRSPLVLGRSRENDVVLRDPGVSRRHVILERTGEGWQLRRLEGAAPVYVNHVEVERALLHVGDVVRIGLCTLELADTSDGELPAPQAPIDAPIVPLPRSLSIAAERPVERVSPAGDEAPARTASSGAPRFIGKSPAAQRLQRLLSRVARSEATVLLVGESGTGKSMAARLLHEESARAGRPFHVVNCAAIPESLIESELFGHTRGAFTGAVDARPGAFETAGNGTIFLDEVGELPLTSQAKLLRVLEERSFQRIGATRPQAMEARVIAATNADLGRMVEEGRLRRDLYYRLSVVRIEVPALRERGDDVLAIAERMLRELARRDGRAVAGFAPDAVAALAGYEWPGNVRELRNAVESAVALGEGTMIEARDLPIPVPTGLAAVDADEDSDLIQLPMSLAALELKAIKAALRVTNGNRTRAASLLGINRVTLYKKLCQPSDREDETVAKEREAVG